MLSDASLALSEILSPPFRAVLWKSVALTIALLVALAAALEAGFAYFVDLPNHPLLEATILFVSGSGLLLGLGYLIAPVASLIAGLFSDEICGIVERRFYPQDPPGRDMSLSAGLRYAVGFTLVAIAVNIVCLLLLLVPGINLVAFFVGNGYLLGRAFFEAAALRFHDAAAVKHLRRRYGLSIFVAGLLIALFVAIPIVNLLTPLFAAAFMTHFHKRLAGSRAVIRA